MPGPDRPLVSVLMPAYNHESYIAAAIESVCAQTYRPLELIVIDDGSSDGTLGVIAGLAERASTQLDRFVVERQSNQGISRTLNRALGLARGDFVATIGSDDLYLPHKIERLQALPEWADAETSVAFGDAYIIDERGDRVGVLEDQSTADLGVSGAESQMLAHCFRFHRAAEPLPLGSYASMLRGSYIPSLATLMRREALVAVGGYDEKMFIEDYGLWLLLAREHPFAVITDVVAEKRFHSSNASVVEKRPIFRDTLQLMVRERAACRSDPIAEAERSHTRDNAYAALRSHGTIGDLVRVVARHPIDGPADLLAARRHMR